MGDITKFDAVYDQNYISALNLLSYWKERDDFMAQMEKSRRRKNR